MNEFPFQSSLSLVGLIDYWKNEKSKEGKFGDFTIRQIDDYLKEHPELLDNIKNHNLLQDNNEFVEFLMSAVIPSANSRWQLPIGLLVLKAFSKQKHTRN